MWSYKHSKGWQIILEALQACYLPRAMRLYGRYTLYYTNALLTTVLLHAMRLSKTCVLLLLVNIPLKSYVARDMGIGATSRCHKGVVVAHR